jgi:hypothetical protein
MRISRSIKPILAVAVGIGASAIYSQVASASVVELGSWVPVPNTTNTAYPELVYTSGVGLSAGLGAISSGDGNLQPNSQLPGGLEADTVVYAPEPYSFNSSAFTGGTGYYDTSLTYTGLAPSGPATSSGGIDQQLLGGGTFTLSLTSVAPASSQPLLTGTISPGSTIISGFDGSTSGAVFTANAVTYTGGAWVTALPSYAILTGNSFAISLTAVNPAFGVSGSNPNYTLNSFNANADGYFDINLSGANTQLPEPATLSLLFVGAGALGLRRRQQKA